MNEESNWDALKRRPAKGELDGAYRNVETDRRPSTAARPSTPWRAAAQPEESASGAQPSEGLEKAQNVDWSARSTWELQAIESPPYATPREGK